MSSATFPAYAKILGSNFSIVRDPGVTRTEFETGPPKQLKTKSRVMVTRSIQIGLDTYADYLAFVAWFRDDINRGGDWFLWTDPMSGQTKQCRFVNGLESEAPAIPGVFTSWTITAKMEAWDD